MTGNHKELKDFKNQKLGRPEAGRSPIAGTRMMDDESSEHHFGRMPFVDACLNDLL